MENGWSGSGRKVTLYLSNGEIVVGWLLFRDQGKLLLALDRDHENIRLVERRLVQMMDISKDEEQWLEPVMGAERLAQLERFEQAIGKQVMESIDLLDVRRLRRLAIKYKEISASAEYADAADSRPTCKPEVVYTSLLASAELVDELQQSQLLPVVQEHTEYLASIIHQETLPGADRDWARGNEINQLLTEAQHDSKAVKELDQGLVEEAKVKAWTRRDSARWVDGVGDVVLGGGFAAANVTAGAIAGIFASLPTLGIGSVAATVGVVTSTYTGLTRLKGGLVTLIRGPEATDEEK